MALAFRVAISVWLLSVAVWDHWRRRVPNWLVLPVMLGALGYQVYLFIVDRPASGLGFALLAWAMLLMMWQLHFFGGGDAKFLMALFALFPTTQFLVLFALVVLAASVPLLIYQVWRRRGGSILSQVRRRLRDGQLLPTEQDLHARGRPYCWTFALPGVIFLWWIW
jgi:Flp pilus assembly protein protease CpaA